MFPASRRPRRLPSVINPMARIAISTRNGSSAGIADDSCSTADEVETATVSV